MNLIYYTMRPLIGIRICTALLVTGLAWASDHFMHHENALFLGDEADSYELSPIEWPEDELTNLHEGHSDKIHHENSLWAHSDDHWPTSLYNDQDLDIQGAQTMEDQSHRIEAPNYYQRLLEGEEEEEQDDYILTSELLPESLPPNLYCQPDYQYRRASNDREGSRMDAINNDTGRHKPKRDACIAPKDKFRRNDVIKNKWKETLYNRLTEAYCNYRRYASCGEDVARMHLNYVADERLAWQLLDSDEHVQTQAATEIFKRATAHFRESRSKQLLGSRQSAVGKALFPLLGKSKATVWRFINRVIDEDIARLFHDPDTWNDGIAKLVMMFHNEQQLRFSHAKGESSEKHSERDSQVHTATGSSASLAADEQDDLQDNLISFPYYEVPDIGNGRVLLGPHFYRVSKALRRATSCDHQIAGRFLRKVVNRETAVAINTPSKYKETLRELIASFKEYASTLKTRKKFIGIH